MFYRHQLLCGLNAKQWRCSCFQSGKLWHLLLLNIKLSSCTRLSHTMWNVIHIQKKMYFFPVVHPLKNAFAFPQKNWKVNREMSQMESWCTAKPSPLQSLFQLSCYDSYKGAEMEDWMEFLIPGIIRCLHFLHLFGTESMRRHLQKVELFLTTLPIH